MLRSDKWVLAAWMLSVVGMLGGNTLMILSAEKDISAIEEEMFKLRTELSVVQLENAELRKASFILDETYSNELMPMSEWIRYWKIELGRELMVIERKIDLGPEDWKGVE